MRRTAYIADSPYVRIVEFTDLLEFCELGSFRMPAAVANLTVTPRSIYAVDAYNGVRLINSANPATLSEYGYQKGRMNRRLFLQRAVGAVMSGSALANAPTSGQKTIEGASELSLAQHSESLPKQKKVSIMYIARYNGQFMHFDDNYLRLENYQLQLEGQPLQKKLSSSRPASTAAEEAAGHLFGDPGNGKDEPLMELQAGVQFEYYNTFFQPQFTDPGKGNKIRPGGVGWMAVIKQESEKQMEEALDMNDGLLRQMYSIDKVYLNDDFNDPMGTKAVYSHMSPTHWN